MSKAREWFIKFGPIGIGFTLYPYQLSLGASVRYWPCIFAPAFSVYLGPVKLWGYISLPKIARRAEK